MTLGTLTKEKHLIVLLIFSEVQSVIIVVRHGGVQTDVVLEMELRSYILTWRQQKVVCLTGCGMNIYETSELASAVTHVLQQGHTYSNNTTPPKSALPLGDHFLSNHHVCPHTISPSKLIPPHVYKVMGFHTAF